jgi:hypothetical protein
MNNQVLKFRKKPVVIDAILWTGSNLREVTTFVEGVSPATYTIYSCAKWQEYCDLVASKGLMIKTLEGQHIATIGDWIIKGVKGECYPCKPDIFELTYEPANHIDQPRAMVVPEGLVVEDRSFIFISSECALPTILVSFKRNDWESRDKFAAMLAAAPAPGDSE